MTHHAAPSKEQSTPHALPSGATLHLQRVQFQRADALRKAVTRAFGGMPLTPAEMKVTLDGLRQAPSAGGALVQRFLMVTASEEVDAAVFACLDGAGLYQPAGSEDRIKVNRELFDHQQHADAARGDQVQIFIRVLEVAVRPFLGALLSAYSAYQRKAESSPSSKAT